MDIENILAAKKFLHKLLHDIVTDLETNKTYSTITLHVLTIFRNFIERHCNKFITYKHEKETIRKYANLFDIIKYDNEGGVYDNEIYRKENQILTEFDSRRIYAFQLDNGIHDVINEIMNDYILRLCIFFDQHENLLDELQSDILTI